MENTEVTFKAKYIKTVPCFSAGVLVSSNTYRQNGRWRSQEEVRKTRNKTYLVIAGAKYYGNSLGYAGLVFEIIDPTENMSIEGLDFHDLYCMPLPRVGEVIDITFSSEVPNY
jgi:1-aminocyclopropane-1-carboxylate deaminase/D-cysteine desulfhydrase-like pyridoxal-dependent ACC family enzyme